MYPIAYILSQPSSAQSLSVSLLLVVSTFVVSTRLVLSLRRTSSWKVLSVSSAYYYIFPESNANFRSSPTDQLKLVDVKATQRETTLALAAAHALVRLDDGTIVGDPMERTTLDALNWQLSKGDHIAPAEASAPHRTNLIIRRRFQFSSALKRMSTISSLPNGRCIVASKGAPETIKRMLATVPTHYDETYKWYTRRGSRVLALGFKETDSMTLDKV